MARKRKSTTPAEIKTSDYRHTGEKRTNIPPAKIAGEGKVPAVPKARYYYNPHLPPVLRFDPTGSNEELDLMWELFEEPFDIRPDGTVHAPDRPGLGFTLRKDAFERFRYMEGPEFVF